MCRLPLLRTNETISVDVLAENNLLMYKLCQWFNTATVTVISVNHLVLTMFLMQRFFFCHNINYIFKVHLQLRYEWDAQQTAEPPPSWKSCPGTIGSPAGKAHTPQRVKPHWADGMRLRSAHWRGSSAGRWIRWGVGTIYGSFPVVGHIFMLTFENKLTNKRDNKS